MTPDPAIDGHQATINGRLSGGGTVATQPIDLWQKLPGQTAFSDIAQTHTDASGNFSFVRSVQTNAAWYASDGGAVSPTVNESVEAAIALHPSTVKHASRVTLTLSGSVAPSHAGERVALEQLHRGRWVTVARPKLDAGSSFVVTRRMHGRSVHRFRVVLAPDAANARSVSTVVTVKG